MQEQGRILLVDDLALFRRMLPMRLGALGRRVDSVSNAEEARSYLAQERPELILLDVIMPGLGGFEYCKELKAEAATASIPVVMLTDLKANALDRSLEVGADDYMPKRVDDAVLRIRVHLHLRLGHLRQQAQQATVLLEGASILLASTSVSIRAQLAGQLGQEGHTLRTHGSLEGLAQAVQPQDRLLIVDMDLGQDKLHDALGELRMNEATANLPVLLLGSKEQLDHLTALEFMVDDVVWKPLAAQVNRHRLRYLIELGLRTFGPA
ncbi:MAG: response regulator [Firmicutes bacterium]|nr:response regulator [Bacillota bacterium]